MTIIILLAFFAHWTVGRGTVGRGTVGRGSCGVWWLIGRVDAYCPRGRGFDSRSIAAS